MSEQPAKPEVAVKNVWAWPPGIFLACLAIGIGGHVAMPLRVLPVWPARIAGVILICLAPALARWAQQVMRAARTNIHPWKPTLALVTSGPFGRMRNPMYTALCLLLLGIGLVFDSAWPIAMTLVLWAALWTVVVAREERYLDRLMGEAYRAYCRDVPRWGWRIRP